MAAPTVAWSAFTAAETADLAADNPMLLTQAIPVSPGTAQWTTVGTVAAADLTDSDYPARRAYDGKSHLDTRSDGTAASTWYYVLDLGSTGIEFDAVALMGHNFGTLSLTTVQLQVADSADFATNLRTTADFGAPSDDTRLIDLAIAHTAGADRYEDVQYARLKLSKGSNFTPQLGELMLLRRRQLNRRPRYPFDPTALMEEAGITRSKGGVVNKTLHHERRFDLNAVFRAHETTYITDLIAWFRATRGPFVWIYEPSSAPDTWQLMMRLNQMSFPTQGFAKRELTLAAEEQGPERFYLDVEVNG
jgi:hypothetical protein